MVTINDYMVIKMKKTIIATSLAVALLSGCISTGKAPTHAELQEQGRELSVASKKGEYSPTLIQEIEIARVSVNSVFLVAHPAYDRYVDTVISQPVVSQYMGALAKLEEEEEKQQLWDSLKDKDKAAITAFLESSQTEEAMKALVEVVPMIADASLMFMALDTTTLLQQVDWKDLMSEKDRLTHTTDQLDYMAVTAVKAYEVHNQASAFASAK